MPLTVGGEVVSRSTAGALETVSGHESQVGGGAGSYASEQLLRAGEPHTLTMRVAKDEAGRRLVMGLVVSTPTA